MALVLLVAGLPAYQLVHRQKAAVRREEGATKG
jgi:hypothetical protein